MGSSSPGTVSTKLERVAELAAKTPKMVLTNLAHHVDVAFLREAYRRTRKDGAVGVDGQTATDYAEGLEDRLQSLLDRFKSGTYRAPPVRRVHIPKGDGRKTRPIGIPTFEDKILQRAAMMLLESVYEADFMDCSYGFRPGRSAHAAVDRIFRGTMDMGGGWVVELDIESFFDSMDHHHLRCFLDQRVRDGVLRRMIDKWLKAGILEDGNLTSPKEGTPQGGVVSPILANIYLHHVLDRWFHEDVLPRLGGRSFMVRYADDAVLVFSREEDARRVLEVLPKRFARFGLRLHPEKTRLVRFRRPYRSSKAGGTGQPTGSFDFLGFTFYWGLSRRGHSVVRHKTASKRLSRSLRAIHAWCRNQRHLPIPEQHVALCRKVRGHYAYFGVTGNSRALSNFVRQVERRWRYWLHRRSGRAKVTWDRFSRILARFPLPAPRVVHSVYRQARP